MFGAHLSIAGGLVNALLRAQALRFDCVQIFTKNQQQWKARPLGREERGAWLDQLRRMGWRNGGGPARTVAHNSYLINLASPDPALRRKSINLQRIEMERCESLEIPYLVAHPGAHLGSRDPRKPLMRPDGSLSRDERAGLKRVVRALDRLHRDLPGYRTITCLEATAGSGTHLGYDFHQLRYLREAVNDPGRVGFCFDTCHVTAAGYDMTTDGGAREVLEEWENLCGISHLHVVHMNDSKGKAGSRIDRHAHIGKGECGLSCFRAIVNHPRLQDVPKVIETPKGETPKGTPYDVLNVRKLKRLVESSKRNR